MEVKPEVVKSFLNEYAIANHENKFCRCNMIYDQLMSYLVETGTINIVTEEDSKS